MSEHSPNEKRLCLCEACERGDHGNCGMQSWCECQDERDGDRESEPDLSEIDIEPLEDFELGEP